MAKEYIEREALKNNIHCTKEGLFFCGGKTYIDFGVVSKAVLETPAADVVEVVHGEWIYHECVSSHDGAISGYSCSNCCAFIDEEVFDMDESHTKYCGACGAKMDGKDGEG